MPETMEQILTVLKPEAAYFYPLHGRRGLVMVVDVTDEADLIPLVEPLWMEMGADVEVAPCLTAQELQAASPASPPGPDPAAPEVSRPRPRAPPIAWADR
ncbi:hypothetical protein ACFQ1I_35540 [Kitasatospora arboriphila]